ncbi:MAG: hypothetical protein RL434_613 [Pseudomonadota bacterium]
MLARITFYLKHLVIWCLLLGVLYWAWLDRKVVAAFNARQWELPARIYASPVELFRDKALSAPALATALGILGYREVTAPNGPGQYSVKANRLDLVTRGFAFPDGQEPARAVRVWFERGRVSGMAAPRGEQSPGIVRLEPLEIGRIHTSRFEDRILLKSVDIPEQFIRALTAVEDRRFFSHIGIDWAGILRAVWVNLLHGGIAQGGSTLTQQLVKNLYLEQERTLKRKLVEALMALSIERQFSKSEILETYVNEVFLGQDGNRAIHGFGLAAKFYYGRPLNELSTPELALLVGMVRGPSRYNPFRYPERALERRSVILDVFVENALISAEQSAAFKLAPLGLRRGEWRTEGRYAEYLDLVRRQLKRDYREEDLRTAGLKVFTSMDVLAQVAAEQAVKSGIADIERAMPRQRGQLQTAVLVSDARTADIKAIIGSHQGSAGGFNRALDAHRQIGSLIKPFIYLTAFSRLPGFNVVTPLRDEPQTWRGQDGKVWSPRNYDGDYHGIIPAREALARSLNLATVDLGFRIGVESLRHTLKVSGVEGGISRYPALFLGALDMTPYEVTQLYQAVANDGFRIPLRAIQAVVDQENRPLKRYGMKVERVLDARSVFLTRYLMTQTVERGTARRLGAEFPGAMPMAGKTGTSNDGRDSWFVGFSGEDVITVWVGRDDNKSAGLTGATGALRIWTEAVRRMGPQAITMDAPEGVDWYWLTRDGSALTEPGCARGVHVPLDSRYLPEMMMPCPGAPAAVFSGGYEHGR